MRLGAYDRDLEVVGSRVADTITTGLGFDQIRGGGNDVLDGGGGFDTAVYAGFRGAYQYSQTRVAGGPEGGFDTLANMEALQFLDGRWVFGWGGRWEPDMATIAIARLYDTVLDRLPDFEGLSHYRGAVDDGYRLLDFARAMVESPEFIGRYGALDNEGLVRQLYRAVLDREVDAKGLAEYTQALNGGLARDELVVILSESPEHKALYQPVWDDQVVTSQNGLAPAAAVAWDDGKSLDALTIPHLDTGHSDWML